MNRIYGTALLTLLRGRDPPRVEVTDELRERARAGDVAAARTVRLGAALDELRDRTRRALAWEATAVVVADGSSLPVDEAERLLENKEERRAHRALRSSIDEARRPLLHFHERRIDDAAPLVWARPASAEPAPGAPPTSAAAALSTGDVLAAFLAATVDLRDAARDALASIGGEPLEDPPALTRALDLPDASGAFGSVVTLALLSAARDARRPARRVARFAAPRLLAGVVVDDGDLHFAQPSRMTRLERHWGTLTAGAAALAEPDVAADADEDGSQPPIAPGALSNAMALCLAGAAARRSLGAPRDVAERAHRAVAATWVLRARARAALAALPDDVRNDVDGARDALVAAFDCDPGRDLTRELCAPRFDVDTGELSTAVEHVLSVPLTLALRETFDERFALVPDAWHERDALAAAARAAISSSPSGSVASLARAWRAWAGELL